MDTHMYLQNPVAAVSGKLASTWCALLQARDVFDVQI